MRSRVVGCAATLVLFAALVADDARAQICGLRACTAGEVCWEATGTLVAGVECDHFESNSGATKATLENWGGLSVGTPVRVKGCYSNSSLGFCVMEGIEHHIAGNTIQSLGEPEPEPVPSIATGGLVGLALVALAIGMVGLRLRHRAG